MKHSKRLYAAWICCPPVKTARLKTERNVRQKKNYTAAEFSLQNDGNFLSQIILIYVFLRGID